jgi:F0F1-type ATP synthase membrane subunit c/vacuolar-type H+-ATPase subunit K
VGIGLIGKVPCDHRQKSGQAVQQITTTLILSIAAEAVAIYALVIALIIKFV